MLRRARENKIIQIKVYNLRDYAKDKHKTVDDTPYGGGPGMVLKAEPIFNCVEDIKQKIVLKKSSSKMIVLLTSAKGKEYDQAKTKNLTEFEDVIIICGRYEGVDERVAKHLADEEISVGKYILTGGEIPALVIVDSVSRLLDGVLGNKESLTDSDFVPEDGTFEKNYPVYTKPENFKGWVVPKVLLGGNHKEIEEYRKKG